MYCNKILSQLCLLSISVLCSCSSQFTPVYLDILQPAKMPMKINSGVVLINNLYQPDVSSGRYMDNGKILVLNKMDVLGQQVIDSAIGYLKQSEFFSIAKSISLAEWNRYRVKDSLTTSILTRIRMETGCRQVVFMDSLRYNIFYSEEIFRPYLVDTTAIKLHRLNIAYRISFRSYIDGVKDPFRHAQVDTLLWHDISKDSLPSLQIALPISADYMAQLAVKQLTPTRIQTERYRYTPYNSFMLKAERLVKKNRWEEAIPIWNFVYKNTESSLLQAKAALNIALAYELKDDYATSLSWLEKSKELFRKNPEPNREDIRMVNEVIKLVKVRNEEKQRLDKQVSANR